MLTYARVGMESLPVVDLPMSEKAGILADMMNNCQIQSADVKLFGLARLLALHALIWVFENCQSVDCNLCI